MFGLDPDGFVEYSRTSHRGVPDKLILAYMPASNPATIHYTYFCSGLLFNGLFLLSGSQIVFRLLITLSCEA
jgi:hypothetical protein